MRGAHREVAGLFGYISIEERVPKKHPIRDARRLVDTALVDLDALFSEMYAANGRPSIPPEQLVRASMLQVLFSIRIERQLMEQLDYNLMFRRSVGLSIDDPVWHPTTFSKNRDRLAQADVGRRLFAAIVELARKKGLVSDEHCSLRTRATTCAASSRSCALSG